MKRIPSGLLAAALLAMPPAHAAEAGDGLRRKAQAWLAAEVARAYPDTQQTVEIGAVDGRLQLPACDAPRFFLPPGSRLWAGGSLGARCEAPKRWSLYLGYEVRLSGPALLSTRPLPARQPIGAGDVQRATVRYAQDPGAYPREIPPKATTLRPIPAGQPIMVFDLALPDVIQAGARVQVRVSGTGFSVAQEGQALNAARAGAPVRVKMPSGRIVRGIASQTGEVDIDP